MRDPGTVAGFLANEQVRGDHFVDPKVDLKSLTIPGLGLSKGKLCALLESKIAAGAQGTSRSMDDCALSADSLREVRV